MRQTLLVTVAMAATACGEVKNNIDANRDTNGVDTPKNDAPQDGTSGPTPKLHWTFDGNTNNTGSINGFALATPNGVTFVNGKVGQAASFGTNQFSSVAGMQGAIGSFAKVTIALWVKEPGTLNSQSIASDINRTTSPFGGVQLGFAAAAASLCVATTTNMLLGGGCTTTPSSPANTFHHWIIRYDGSGTGTAQGGPTEVYFDGNLVITQMNDTANNPVFTPTGLLDTLTIGAPGTVVDDVKIYDQVFTPADQCTFVIGGTLSGTTCTLP